MLNKKQNSTVKQQHKNLKLLHKFSFTATFLHLSYATAYFKNSCLNKLKQRANYVNKKYSIVQYSTVQQINIMQHTNYNTVFNPLSIFLIYLKF